CAVLIRGKRALVLDFDSTNGTFVNNEPVKGERELHDQDELKAGPLAFRVSITQAAPAKPKPAAPPAEPSEDDSAAAMLLSLGDDEGGSVGRGGKVDEEGIPTGSTVMEAMTPLSDAPPEEEAAKNGPHKPQPAKAGSSGDTSSAAKAILDKYI